MSWFKDVSPERDIDTVLFHDICRYVLDNDRLCLTSEGVVEREGSKYRYLTTEARRAPMLLVMTEWTDEEAPHHARR